MTSSVDTVTLDMATTCEKHATSVEGAQAARLLRYAGAMRKCKPRSPCGMDACPRCGHRHVKKNVGLVEALIRNIPPESLRFLDFTIPRAVPIQELEQATGAVLAAATRLTKANTVWSRYVTRWAGQVRAKLDAAQGAEAAFRLSIRTVVEVQPLFDLVELEKRWRVLLHSLGLAAPDLGDAALVQLAQPQGDTRRQARRICRTASFWLRPIIELTAPGAIAYHKVLPGLLRLRACVLA